MPLVASSTSRATLTDSPRGLAIEIPASRAWPVMLFLAFWLCGWAMGEMMVLHTLLEGETDAVALVFLSLWLVGWTVGGGFAIWMLFWSLAGSECIVLSASRLSVTREIFGLGRERAYELAHVSNLRLSADARGPHDQRSSARARGVRGLRGGAIAFDHLGKTIRFGAGLAEEEARAIVETMRSRAHFPEASDPRPWQSAP